MERAVEEERRVRTRFETKEQTIKDITNAIAGNDIEAIKRIIQSVNNINDLRNENGCTPLYIACEFNNPEIVDILIGAGADVNETDNDGFSPLHVACEMDLDENHPILTKLITSGADINKVTENRYTPFTIACAYSNPHCALYLARLPGIKLYDEDLIHPIVAICMNISNEDKEGRDMTEFWSQKLEMVIIIIENAHELGITITDRILSRAIQKINGIDPAKEEGFSQALKDSFLYRLRRGVVPEGQQEQQEQQEQQGQQEQSLLSAQPGQLVLSVQPGGKKTRRRKSKSRKGRKTKGKGRKTKGKSKKRV